MNVKDMPKRIAKRFTCHSFGFPVVLTNIAIAGRGDNAIPLIDYKDLERTLLRKLPHKSSRLTGAEVKFIRRHFGMTLAEFGKHFGVSHVAVRKWESKGIQPTSMTWSTEKDLRMFVERRLGKSRAAFVALYDGLQDPPPSRRSTSLTIDIAAMQA